MLQTRLNKKVENNSIIDLLSSKAIEYPNKVAFKYLINGEDDVISISYGQLVSESKRIATYLYNEGFTGKRALIMYHSSIDYIKVFLGCLYAGVIAVPVYPPSLSRNMDRVRSIMADANTNLVLTTSQLYSRIAKQFNKETSGFDIKWVCIDKLDPPLSEEWKHPNITGDSIAFLQYTSGSTSAPKGVMISHNNILHNQEMIKNAFQTNEHTVAVGWLPLYHDMGLIGNVLQPLYLGATSILMSPMDFLKRPFSWLKAISKYKATVSGGPNFAYDLCIKKITEEEKAQIDLSSWQLAFNGAEPIRYETIKKFSDEFSQCGFKLQRFYPCYGMAEATLLITGGDVSKGPVIKHFDSLSLTSNKVIESSNPDGSVALVSSGTSDFQEELCIVNPKTHYICSENEIGEIWVRGKNVANGYFGTGESSDFSGRIQGRSSTYLKTGDLGFINEGQLFVTGRLKDVIILRGKNYYPQDIELITENAHEGVRKGCIASFSVTHENEDKLVIVAEAERAFRPRIKNVDTIKIKLKEITTSIRKNVMEEIGIQPYCICLIKTGSILKTSSGKIQRSLCKQGFLNNELEVWHIDTKI